MTNKKQQFAAYIFGLVFIITMLVLAVIISTPTEFQYLVFRIVLSLAAAGVAAMIPGFIELTVPKFIQAGGAIAIFVIVYFYNPASLITTTQSPSFQAAKDFVEEILAASSSNDIKRQMKLFSERVDYFNKGIVGKSVIETDRSNYIERWPIRKYWLEEELALRFWNNDKEFEASLIVGFSMEDGTNKREGQIVNQKLRARREGSDFKITYVKEIK
jgi:hypothetical protein